MSCDSELTKEVAAGVLEKEEQMCGVRVSTRCLYLGCWIFRWAFYIGLALWLPGGRCCCQSLLTFLKGSELGKVAHTDYMLGTSQEPVLCCCHFLRGLFSLKKTELSFVFLQVFNLSA